MTSINKIKEGEIFQANCPSCKSWLWRVNSDCSIHGDNPLEVAGQYMATDGDTIPFGEECPLPKTEFDSEVLIGTCPKCCETYWFVDATFLSSPIPNLESKENCLQFICESFYNINFSNNGMSNYEVSDKHLEPFVICEELVEWNGKQVKAAVCIIGPFKNGDHLNGRFGVACCVENSIWQEALDKVLAAIPIAKEILRKNN